MAGEMVVYSQSGEEIRTLEKGNYFGELAALGISSLRTSSVRATKFTELMYITKDDLYECFEKHPEVIEVRKRPFLQTTSIFCLCGPLFFQVCTLYDSNLACNCR